MRCVMKKLVINKRIVSLLIIALDGLFQLDYLEG
jgi:hypothetical protein